DGTRDVGDADDAAVLQALDRDLDDLGDPGGRDRDGQRHERELVDGAGGGLADDVDRDLDGDLLASASDDEVDVLDGAADRVALDVLGEGHLVAVLDLEGDDGVRVVLEDEEGVVGGQREVAGSLAVPVEDGGDEVRAAGAARGTLAELGAEAGGEGGCVGHGDLLLGVGTAAAPGRGATRGTRWHHRVDHGAGGPASLAEATCQWYPTAPSALHPHRVACLAPRGLLTRQARGSAARPFGDDAPVPQRCARSRRDAPYPRRCARSADDARRDDPRRPQKRRIAG